jgi:hypothetical protein
LCCCQRIFHCQCHHVANIAIAVDRFEYDVYAGGQALSGPYRSRERCSRRLGPARARCTRTYQTWEPSGRSV